MPLSASLRIDPQRGKTPVNPMIYGHFLEHFHRQVYGGLPYIPKMVYFGWV